MLDTANRISISSVLLATLKNQSMCLPIRVAEGRERIVETKALLDSGAGGMFIDQNVAKENRLLMKHLTKPILAQNVDGTPNKNSTITHYTTTDLLVGDQMMKMRFLVSGLELSSDSLGCDNTTHTLTGRKGHLNSGLTQHWSEYAPS